MTETEKFLSIGGRAGSINPSFLNDEVMLIDNVKLLGMPDVVRPNMNIIAICKKGRMHVEVNGSNVVAHANQIFICPSETALVDPMFSADFEYTALCMSNRMVQQYLNKFINVWNEFAFIHKIRVVSLDGEELKFYEKFYELLHLTMNSNNDGVRSIYREDILNSLLSTALIGFCSLLQNQMPEVNVRPKQNTSLFNQFLELLQSTDIKHQKVDFYASQMFISAKYLTVICKKNSGKTANDWIQEYTVNDISYYLQNTFLSMKEISNKLGFPNTSFFGKYVKEHLGCTPMEFRMQKKSAVQQ